MKTTDKKITLKKDRIANLTSKQLENVHAGIDNQDNQEGLEGDGGGKNSTKNDFTCTWCGHSVPCVTTTLL